jgi:hypothetical protein
MSKAEEVPDEVLCPDKNTFLQGPQVLYKKDSETCLSGLIIMVMMMIMVVVVVMSELLGGGNVLLEAFRKL